MPLGFIKRAAEPKVTGILICSAAAGPELHVNIAATMILSIAGRM